MKSNYFLINCFLLTSSLFCMDDSPLVRCPQNRERHHHDCVITTHRSSDWNCFGCVTDKISLQANKIWLMTLFLSNVNSRGIPTGDPGLLRVIHCIERFRIATTKNIQQMQVFALEPAAASYIKRCEQFIADIADAEKKCGKQLMEIIAWLKRIPKAQDVNDCRQLEKKFNETYQTAIKKQDEAKALIDLNPVRSRTLFEEIKKSLEDVKPSLANNKKLSEKLDKLLTDVNSELELVTKVYRLQELPMFFDLTLI